MPVSLSPLSNAFVRKTLASCFDFAKNKNYIDDK